MDSLTLIEELAHKFQNEFIKDSIVLYAGANIPSPKALNLMGSTLGSMPAMGYGPNREQPGVTQIAEIEATVEKLAVSLFQAEWAAVTFPTCTLANLAIYATLAQPGDLIAVTPGRAGGHVSHQPHGAPGLFKLQVIELAYDTENQIIDDAQSAQMILKKKPKIVMLGSSYMPFAYSFEQILAACKAVSATLVYDIAHVAGLVLGGKFPNPLLQGADLITMSTYKSLGGPSGALMLGRQGSGHLEKKLRDAAYPKMLANYNAARVAAIGVALCDMQQHARPYAQQMIANAMSLKKELKALGHSVLATETHHVALPRSDAEADSNLLEQYHLICGTTSIQGSAHARALRIGTQLITRRGFKPKHMPQMAHYLNQVLTKEVNKAIKKEIKEWSHQFSSLLYTA